MKKIISEYIIHAEALLLINLKNRLIKSYLLKLKSLKKVPDAHLSGFDEAIPLIYEAIRNVEDMAQTKVMFKLFSAMVSNTKNAVEAERISRF
jgi:hypothetical protein